MLPRLSLLKPFGSVKNIQPRLWRWLGIPSVLTLLAMLSFWWTDAAGAHVLILVIVCVAWGGAGLLVGRSLAYSAGVEVSAGATPAVLPAVVSPVITYYTNVLTSMQRHGRDLEYQHQYALAVFSRMSLHLGQATDWSKSTGLLAANALMAASRCGDVGRGFVTVSRDMSEVLKHAEPDLQKLANLVARLQARLLATPIIDFDVAREWLETQGSRVPMSWTPQALKDLDDSLLFASRTVEEMLARYENDFRMDVRWLQMGEAIKLLLTELGDTLFNLHQSIEKVLAEWRILGISQPVSASQLVELKRNFPAAEVAVI